MRRRAVPFNEYTGAEDLRAVVNVLNACVESFNDRYTAEELLTIVRMLRAAEWDILPDRWTRRQVKRALRGIVPTWSRNQRPTYPKVPR